MYTLHTKKLYKLKSKKTLNVKNRTMSINLRTLLHQPDLYDGYEPDPFAVFRLGPFPRFRKSYSQHSTIFSKQVSSI